MTNFARSSEQVGGRKLVTGAAVAAVILLVAAWFGFDAVRNAVPTQSQSIGNAGKQNRAGEQVARQNPADEHVNKPNVAVEEHTSGGSSNAREDTSEPIDVSGVQRATLRSIFAIGNPPTVKRPNFELMIGAAVAKQTPLADLPPEVPKVLNGFSGDKYVIAGDELVIVDQHSRRVAAVIGGIKS